MKVKDILRHLNLGNSVAEFDEELEHYFVETETFRALTSNARDIIAGDKGTGKTALYKFLIRRYDTIPELEHVEIIPGFNPSGNSVFQRLAEGDTYTEGQYGTIWKAYILSLVGNYLLKYYEDNPTLLLNRLEEMLKQMGLRTKDFKPSTVFNGLFNLVRRLANPKSAATTFTLTEQGMPSITPKVEFGGSSEAGADPEIIRHADAFSLLNAALDEVNMDAWVVLDRLDEAFQGYPKTEIPALRSLFRTYLDLLEFNRVKLKLFVRNDLFRKVTKGGFVNLTHINARKIEIVWEDEDLLNLLFRRVRTNAEFMRQIKGEQKTKEEIFYTLFPEQVDTGLRRAKTWSWIMSRIRDANGVRPPRNLIDLVLKAREAQLRQEDRDAREYVRGTVLITPDSIRVAHGKLSRERVWDTLLAESGEYVDYIDKFRDGKAEYNEASIMNTLGVSDSEVKQVIKILMEMGFLEQTGGTYKIPVLYREGLNITQGKAF